MVGRACGPAPAVVPAAGRQPQQQQKQQPKRGFLWVGGVGPVAGGAASPPSGARPSRWRLCVRALAKQCFASKAPSPM
ncbi:hypothetical protein D7Y26_14535 [Stenotrophomonas maltophilia]|nr:hypothetical protein [Stenotrophomonas maltophilia]MBA0324818.1 hypothetical protein [Stenotrophomonas maltophilia]